MTSFAILKDLTPTLLDPNTLYGFMSRTQLEQATDYALAQLKIAEGEIHALPKPLQIALVINSAQGIIDNGGLEYFYESDFDGTPLYSQFVDAYRTIGAEAGAVCIDASHRMFPFEKPHLHELKRQQWLDTVRNNEDSEFVKLSRKICGDEVVWKKLAEYVTKNHDAFRAV